MMDNINNVIFLVSEHSKVSEGNAIAMLNLVAATLEIEYISSSITTISSGSDNKEFIPISPRTMPSINPADETHNLIREALEGSSNKDFQESSIPKVARSAIKRASKFFHDNNIRLIFNQSKELEFSKIKKAKIISSTPKNNICLNGTINSYDNKSGEIEISNVVSDDVLNEIKPTISSKINGHVKSKRPYQEGKKPIPILMDVTTITTEENEMDFIATLPDIKSSSEIFQWMRDQIVKKDGPSQTQLQLDG